MPDQLKLPFALWTREAVAVLIERKTTKRLSLDVVGRYLKSWGMSPQRPVLRATERNETAVQQWLRDDYPNIAARAKAEGAEIQWADETGVSNQANYGRSYAPIGETPVIPGPAARFSQSMISSVTNRGEVRFMVYDGALNVPIFLTFLKRLIKGCKRKLFLSTTISSRRSPSAGRRAPRPLFVTKSKHTCAICKLAPQRSAPSSRPSPSVTPPEQPQLLPIWRGA